MSDIGFYINRARQAYSRVSAITEELAKNPADMALRASLTSAERLAARADADALDVSREKHIDVVRYRLVERTRQDFRVNDVTHSLWAFQDLLSHTYLALTSGPRTRAGLTTDARDKTTLHFGWTFPGSLGVVLLAPSEHKLFDGRFDETVAAMRDLVNSRDQDEVKDAGKVLGPAVVYKAFDWAQANTKGDFDLDLQWRLSEDRMVGGLIEKRTFEHFVDAVSTTNDVDSSLISTRGVLVGINSKTKAFHFVEPQGESYRGRLDDAFPSQQEWAINHTYDAEIIAQTTLEYATNQEQTIYRLRTLK
jgi:hypothetical protein